MTELLVYLLTGKLIIFSLQKFPFQKVFPRLFKEGGFLEQLFSCDFCLGFWVYSGLAFIFNMNLFSEYFYVLVVCEALTGIVASFVMHLLTIGWNDKFGTIFVE